MFFTIEKIELAALPAEELHNPQTPGNAMTLGIFRTKSRMAFYTVYSKKAYAEYWDHVTGKKIVKRRWTPEMKSMAERQVAQAPKAPFIFKLTVVGWLFVLLVIGFFAYLAYDSVKPARPKSESTLAMEKPPIAGDIYFGHYEAYSKAGDRIASDIGFGWFKVVKVEGNTYYIAMSTTMSKSHKPKEQLNSSDFETEGIPVTISEQQGYMITFKAVDGTMDISVTDKK